MLFACIFVPDFAAEALARVEPDLRDTGVAVVEGKPPLLTVIAANERARQAGVECGMTNVQAAARLNRAAPNSSVIRCRSPLQEKAAHAALADCARAISPRVEELAEVPDTVLLDLNGLDRLFGTPRKIACELAQRASGLGLETNVAVSANLDAAICAARGFGGTTVIPAGKEAERLASLPIEILLQVAVAHESIIAPAAYGKRKKYPSKERATKDITTARANEILDIVDRWGVRTFRALAALPEIAVAERLGPEGVYLQKLCRGEGTRTLVPTDTPLVFEETIELEYPIDDLEPLAFVLSRLLEQLCTRLSARALSTNALRLHLELERAQDYDITKPQSSDRRPGIVVADDRAAFYERTLHLPVPMLDAKIFLRLWQLELRSKPPMAAITRVGFRAEPVQPRHTQGGLFLPTAPEPERLELTLARIAAVVGDKNDDDIHSSHELPRSSQDHKSSRSATFDSGSRFVRSTHTVTKPPLNEMIRVENSGWSETINERSAPMVAPSQPATSCDSARIGSPEILDTHRSDAFRMRRFSPSSKSTTTAQEHPAANDRGNGKPRDGATALRLFRPPLVANMDVIDGRPTRIVASGQRLASQTISGQIVWCTGPWRKSGEWWDESWAHEEWDIAVEDDGGRILCRVYRDEQCDAWFVEGVYD